MTIDLVSMATVKRVIRWMGDKISLMKNVEAASKRIVFRGQVYWCQFGENIGSEQCKRRPAVILQNNSANRTSPNTIVAPLTSKANVNHSVYQLKNKLENSGQTSFVLLGNIVTVSKARLGDYISVVKKEDMEGIEAALYASLGVAHKISKKERKIAKLQEYTETLKEEKEQLEEYLYTLAMRLHTFTEQDPELIIRDLKQKVS